MVKSMVLAPDEISGLDAVLGGVEGLSRLLVEQTRRVVPLMLSLARSHRPRWMECVAEVAAGHTDRVQAERDALAQALQSHLEALRRTTRLASIAESLAGETVVGANELPTCIVELERLRAEVFDRWQTVEDLEDLAAASFPLPAARLRDLASQHPAPQAWYDQQGEPF
jgi:hypothetical protein